MESIAGVHDFSNRFTTSALSGKLLGTCLDLPDSPLPTVAIGTIKQFVGDDPVKVEAKYKNSQTIYRKPLLLFAGNHPIRFSGIAQEQALLNQMVIIPFSNPVQEEDMEYQLYEQLLSEAPYIVSQAIRAYRDLMRRNFSVTRVELSAEYAPQDSRQNYHCVAQFLSKCCFFDVDSEIETQALYVAYLHFAENKGLPHFSAIEFSRLLSEQLATKPNIEMMKRAGITKNRGYRGIGLCDDRQE